VLNQISQAGLKRLPAERTPSARTSPPDAILVRSADLHKLDIASLGAAIGRAGAGTNNIPVKAMSGAACRCSTRRAPTPTR
jgi:D-3-phosphoglycerate dehydrogenase